MKPILLILSSYRTKHDTIYIPVAQQMFLERSHLPQRVLTKRMAHPVKDTFSKAHNPLVNCRTDIRSQSDTY